MICELCWKRGRGQSLAWGFWEGQRSFTAVEWPELKVNEVRGDLISFSNQLLVRSCRASSCHSHEHKKRVIEDVALLYLKKKLLRPIM